ncbi:MAG TPA: GNAT family N-acetyltransferase [Solirubrobacteraceae bacterium]|jgi:phosphinothricin acetyltransferase|nr:GNAT family N-acetyltransferase [Solirubrobacteraceae bacterium]
MIPRLARAGDLEAVVAIYNAAIPGRSATADLYAVSTEQRRAWLLERDPRRRPAWVLEDDGGALLGWLALDDFNSRPAYAATAEVGCYLDPAAQGRGLGRALLAHALQAAPGCGVERLVAKVFPHNEASVRLFAAAGFVEWGRLPGVTRLDGRLADVLVLGRAVP